METAKAKGLEPFEHLIHLLRAMPNLAQGDLEGLLLWSDALPACNGSAFKWVNG